jgi:uncharacterized protein YndB with AHSA1/START domain
MPAVTAEIHIQAPVEFAYRAFTNSTSLREWLCNIATVDPHPQGRIYLAWRRDFFSSGHYHELEENKKVVFQWYSNTDPGPSQVVVTVKEKDGGAHLKLDHNVPDDSSWLMLANGFLKYWEDSLQNLKSVLETGIDLRISTRPMLGIIPGEFTPEQAAHLKVPVYDGMRLDGVVEGMGAQKAGLQRNDVLIKMGGKPITNEFNSLLAAIAGKRGGDSVDIVFYRGAEKKTVPMQLSKRPMPEVPFDPAELAKKARALYEPALAELEKCFEGYSNEQAMKRPDPKEWNALEVVAHLIQGERFSSIHLTSLINGHELIAEEFEGNVTAQVEATVKANPSIPLMLDALRRSVEEILNFTELIPANFAANKGSYYRFGSILLQPNFHLSAHTQQIKDALAAAKD